MAIIIGNKAYPNDSVLDVVYAHNDADAFYRFVTEHLGFLLGNVVNMRDATQGQMRIAFDPKSDDGYGDLRRLVKDDGSSDIVVFYSGHGVPVIDDKRDYLLPVDADPNVTKKSGYPIDLLYENLGKVPSRSVTVFLDACFSGNSPRGMLIGSASPVYVEMDVSGAASGLTVLTAASGVQLASWDEEARHVPGQRPEHLHRHLPSRVPAGGSVHLAEAAAAEQTIHLVLADPLRSGVMPLLHTLPCDRSQF